MLGRCWELADPGTEYIVPTLAAIVGMYREKLQAGEVDADGWFHVEKPTLMARIGVNRIEALNGPFRKLKDRGHIERGRRFIPGYGVGMMLKLPEHVRQIAFAA